MNDNCSRVLYKYSTLPIGDLPFCLYNYSMYVLLNEGIANMIFYSYLETLTVRVYIHKCSHSVLLFPTLQLIFLDPGEESAPLSRGQSFRSTLGWDRYSLFEFASGQLRRTVKQIYSFSDWNLSKQWLWCN